MPTVQPSPTGELREMIKGMLTLLEWQEQLARGALAKLDENDETDEASVPAEDRPGPR